MNAVTAIWWLTCILWSSVWLFIKIGVTDVPPISFAGLRLSIAVLLLLPAVWIHRRQFPRNTRDHAVIASTGFLLLGVNYAFVFWGTQFISSGMTATLQSATPAFGLVIARIKYGTRLTASQIAGAILGIAGVATVSANQLHLAGEHALLGSIAVAAGAACVALAYILMKSELPQVSPLIILFEQMVVAMVPLLVAGFVMNGNPIHFAWTTRSIVALLYLATVGSVAAFWLNLWLLKRTTAEAILAMSIVEPLLAIALGALVLQERLHGLAAIGAILILLSVWLLVLRRPDPAANNPSPSSNS